MLQPATLSFLKALKKNNNKEWFDSNRSKYEAAKTDFEKLVAAIIDKLKTKDPSIGELKPKDCTFRINRDVRFSKNKAPYKTNLAMYIARGGKKSIYAGYYLHVEPGSGFLAAGAWMPMPPELAKIRQEIDYSVDEFTGIIASKKFKSVFGDLQVNEETSLTRPPKGYDDSNPAIRYIKLKSFITTSALTDDQFTAKNFVQTVISNFETAIPLVNFFNRAME